MWPIPTFAKEITLQIDLATTAIALIALIFSVWSFYHQRRITIETIRVQRDNDVIGWTNGAIDVLVGAEFLLRDWAHYLSPREFSAKRDDYLARLSAIIDKGRLYFPNFVRDVVGTEMPSAFRGRRHEILDRLVEIYDLIKALDPANPAAIEAVRNELMLKKRAFVSHAQSAVEPNRRLLFLKDHR
jgi:hypothetical protein